MFNRITPVVKNLLLVNVAIFLIQVMVKLPIIEIGGLRYIHAETFRAWQIITHMFIHSSGMHLFSNMFALFIFGPMLESFWGPKRFFMFYLATGLGAALLYSGVHYYEVKKVENAAKAYIENPDPERYLQFLRKHGKGIIRINYDEIDDFQNNPGNQDYINESKQLVDGIRELHANIPMVGASGAIFGILIAFALLFPNTELFMLFIPFPIKAKYYVGIYALFEIYAGVKPIPGDNVAHFAHIGGMIFGFILVKIWNSQRDKFF